MASSTRTDRANVPAFRSISVVLLFVGSGCAALIYEVVWFHMLRLVIGGSSISLGILLASFMGGMCVGSWALARLVPADWHPLRVYAALELAIGLIGATLPWWLPLLADLYLRVADESLTGISARAVVAAVAILPATIMMGATLPAIARWVKSTPEGYSQLGVFYGANIFGAVIGCLLAGFLLLPWTDKIVTSYVAAAINLLVAGAAYGLSRGSPYTPPGELEDPAAADTLRGMAWEVYAVIALSGFAALAAEVVWTRLLGQLFGSTVYTFAIILAVFLTGLGLGSTMAARAVKHVRRPLLWLAVAQLMLLCLAPYANAVVTWKIPFWIRPEVNETSDVYSVFLHDSWRAAAAILPSALLWGASFPLALAAAGRGRRDSAYLVGQVYSANTLGAIFGALLASAVMIPTIGTQQSQRVIALASGAAAIIAFGFISKRTAEEAADARNRRAKTQSKTMSGAGNFALPGFVAIVAITLVAAWLVVAPPKGFFARSLAPELWDMYEDVFQREGRTSTVVVQKHIDTGYHFLCIGGKVEASNYPPDLRCQRLLGHLAALFHPAPRRTLTVGMGTGTTAGCFVLHPEIEENVICEIEPVVPMASRVYFAKENNGVVDHHRTKFHFDDARHFLSIAGEHEKFDIITSDPINSWIRGTATLYSTEHFERCKQRLNPGGIMVQWIPLYEKDLITAKCELATFLTAFPNATLWTSWTPREGTDARHDIIAIGQLDPVKIDLLELERRLQGNPAVQAALAEVNLASVAELMGQYAGSSREMQPWMADAPINRDRSLRLEYLAGLSLWLYDADMIFNDITQFRTYPAGILVNGERYEREIRQRLNLPK